MNPSAPPVVLVAERLIDGAGHDGPGWVFVVEGRISALGHGSDSPAGAAQLERHRAGVIMPGLVDIHAHGAKGVDFAALGVDPQPAIDHHRAAGAATLIASLATAPFPVTVSRLQELQPSVGSGGIAGIHLEGPWLSRRRRGAHASGLLRMPDLADLDTLLRAGDGAIRMVTLAPELPGATQVIHELVDAGVVAAIGHTDADADTVARAVDAGATVVTHLFNGMPPLHHRAPGPVGVALADERLTLELIADGEHVHDTVTEFVLRTAAARVALVSDAMAAAGLGDGTYELAGSRVTVSGGVARLADGTSLAGGTATVGDIATRLLARGLDAAHLLRAASSRPAAILGLAPPTLAAGSAASLIAIDATGPIRVMSEGRWAAGGVRHSAVSHEPVRCTSRVAAVPAGGAS